MKQLRILGLALFVYGAVMLALLFTPWKEWAANHSIASFVSATDKRVGNSIDTPVDMPMSIAGDAVVSRQTVSALANLGLADELAFADIEAYIAGAVALAGNPQRLAELRAELRPRMAASPLRDAAQFTRDLEALYRRMWGAWCSGEKLKSDVALLPDAA